MSDAIFKFSLNRKTLFFTIFVAEERLSERPTLSLQDNQNEPKMKIAILGAGNMGCAIACGLVGSGRHRAEEIVCTARTAPTLERLRTLCPGVRTTTDNADAVRGAAVVMLAVKPWLVEPLIREIGREIDPDRQSVVSVAAGVSLAQLSEWLTADRAAQPALFRAIPNTAIAVRQSMTFVSVRGADTARTERVMELFRELGEAMLVEEPMLETGMILASCGIAFALRYVRAAVEGGVELGCPPQQATRIVAATLRGAAELLLQRGDHPEAEIDRVTTPGGITVRGLNEMERAGFSSAVIRGLKACK